MPVDFFENGLCFYCHSAKNELQTYSDFHSKTEMLWKAEDKLLQENLDSILKKYPEANHQDIVESHGWDMHLNQYKYPDIHRLALIVSIYTFIEDQLNGLCKTLGDSLDTRLRLTDLKGRGMGRALSFLSKIALFDLDTIPSLSFVQNVNKLRNKIVHAGGVLPGESNDNLNKFVKDTLGLRGEPGGCVHIDSVFIDHLMEQLICFFDKLDEQVHQFMVRAK